jgi:cytochrome c
MTRATILLLITIFASGCAHRPESEEAKRGRDHIQYYGCTSCHTIPGIDGAHATVGPPLDRMGTRTYIAGILPNDVASMSLWIQHPQRIHPGNAMPELGVTSADANDIARYLEELH